MTVHVFIDLYHRPKAATTDTTYRFESETLVLGGFPITDIQGILNSISNPFPTPYMAGRTQTDGYDVSASGFETERAVKCRHTINMTVRHIEFGGKIGKGGAG